MPDEVETPIPAAPKVRSRVIVIFNINNDTEDDAFVGLFISDSISKITEDLFDIKNNSSREDFISKLPIRLIPKKLVINTSFVYFNIEEVIPLRK